MTPKGSKSTSHGAFNFIAGKWVRSPKGGSFENINPATEEVIDVYPDSTAEDVDQAVKAARKAFDSWRKVPVAKRGEILLKVMQVLVSQKEEIAKAMTREMGKILRETRGDVQEAIDTAFYYAGEGRRLFGQTTTSELPDKFSMSIRMPMGVCGLITPWNFPAAIPSWKVFPALICGNTVVLKPASDTPESSMRLVKALEEAGVPSGVVNLVYGRGSTTGKYLLEHPGVSLISFTGSSDIGSQIGASCGKSFKKCSLEMGGKNAQIVMEDADLDLALEGAVWGAFGTSGQRCTATSRVIVHEKVFKQFEERFVDRVKKIKVGNGLKDTTEMGPVVNKGQLEKVLEYIEIGKNKDKARLLTGGERYTEGECAKGYFLKPAVFEGTPKMRIAQEEIFGPVTVLLKVKSFEEAIQVLNDTAFGLSGSIYTRDVNRVMRAIRDMETGITYINAPTIGAEVHMPFGGVKQTGNGHREAGTAALDIFSDWKAVYVDYSGTLQRAQIDTHD
ncbi:MAG: aldehyde dehydrogenase family protein [Elusimicrobia bacterium]|nr:aldehyde dehydrogenase family protein [Elusimicrobiota bacterium]